MMLVVKFMMSCDLRRAVSLRAFDLKIYGLIILLLSFLLQGCGISNDALLDDDLVKIVYVSKENIIPAQWVFSTETDETLASVQWQFSDGSVSNRTPEQDQNVEHTFNRAGFHIIKLQYETASGQQGTSERGVNIRSGEISGKIFAASNTLVDVDTREPNEPNRENNSFASAQPLATNTRLSGVVDVSDSDDFYQVQLQKDQTINLQVADEVNRVFESIQFQVFSSTDTDNPLFNTTTDVGSGHLEVPFIVPANGRYFIQLTAVSPSKTEVDGKYVHSHGNYSLHIEAATGGADFVAGELIVMMKESTPNTVQAQSSLQKRPNGLIKRMDLGRIKTFSLTNARQFMAARNINYSASLDNNSRWQTLQAARLLAAQDDVLYAEPNWKRYPTALAAVTDPLYTSQWHYDSINLESAWQAMGSRGSADVTVAVLDTGVLTAHPDLSDNLIAGYDFIESDENANDPGDKSNGGQSSSFHGTHVAGTIAASNNDIGGTGIAPGVKIMPVRVLGRDGGTSSQIIAGLCFAAQLNSGDNTQCHNAIAGEPADIINLSLGGPDSSNIEQAVYDAIMGKGIIVIAAAGNESSSAPFYPASYDNVISVSATNRNSELASYSNFGGFIDVAAPGGDSIIDQGVMSSWGDDSNGAVKLTYGYLQGTSMAAPHVAGIAALMKSAKPDLNHFELRDLLIGGHLTQDIGDAGRDNKFGYGLIDAHKAVLKSLGDGTPRILTSANSVFFDVSQVMRSFRLIASSVNDDSELGAITATISDADNGEGGSWLALSKHSGLGEYTATVTRGQMTEGTYYASINISSDAVGIDEIVISVVLQIGNAQLTANAGVQYVVVLNEEAVANNDGVFTSVIPSGANIANKGEYNYQVSGLAKGRYTISTGSDMDFDNEICDAGESCGQYPTLAQSAILVISEQQSSLNINMSVNYLTSSIGAASTLAGELISPRVIKKYTRSIEDTESYIKATTVAKSINSAN